MDIDLDDEALDVPSGAGYTTLPPEQVVFDSTREEDEEERGLRATSITPAPQAPPEGEEDAWATLG